MLSMPKQEADAEMNVVIAPSESTTPALHVLAPELRAREDRDAKAKYASTSCPRFCCALKH